MNRLTLPHSLVITKNYSNGNFVTTDKRYANISPVDGAKLSDVCEADKALVDATVLAAKEALNGPWGRTTVEERADYLFKVAALMEKRYDEFIAAEVLDTGRPVHQAKALDVYRGMHNLRTFAELFKHQFTTTECYESHLSDGSQLLNITKRSPLGVVVSISPWNLPLLSATWKAAPILMAGNTIICKPSEESPSSATLLAECFDEAGVPPGVFNVLHGFGKDSTGAFLTENPAIDAITFTGESNTGSTIMKTAAAGVKPLSFELGGKNAAIVFEDADFDAAVDGIIRSSFTNSGQVCLCSERVFVQRSIFNKFVQAITEKTEQLKIGWPEDDQIYMGPLVSKGHREKVLSYMKLAVEEGATVHTGGTVPEFGDLRDQGAYIRPTIWTGLSDDARCMQEEVFGPVTHIAPFDSEEEVIARANNTNYGLAGVIWTSNLSRAHRVAPQINAGIVWVNHWFARDLRTPFGGNKLSGIGREGGRHSLEFYSNLNNISIRV